VECLVIKCTLIAANVIAVCNVRASHVTLYIYVYQALTHIQTYMDTRKRKRKITLLYALPLENARSLRSLKVDTSSSARGLCFLFAVLLLHWLQESGADCEDSAMTSGPFLSSFR
jgi:hypothetical protein